MRPINEQGNILWEKIIGTPDEYDCPMLITYYDINRYLVSGCTRINNQLHQSLILMYGNGDIIWEKNHPFEEYPYLGNLIANPIINDDLTFLGTSTFLNEYDESEPVLIQYNQTGQILWIKSITNDPIIGSFLFDIDKTEDEGYFLTGYLRTSPRSSWSLKVDIDGNTCYPSNCDSTITNTSLITHSLPFITKITPNPATNFIEIQDPPPTLFILKLYNINGQKVLESIETIVSLENLKEGIYFYEIWTEGEVFNKGKVVIQY